MTKKYNIIYADPPWQFNSVKSGGSMKSGAAAKYNVMSLEQLKALDVPALCEKDCVLIMWYVSSQPQEALDLVKAWGFTIKNMNAFIWRKLSTNLIPHFGMGYWTRGGAECALLAVRGKPKSVCKSIRQVRDEPVGEHSEKPGIFRDDIVKLCGDLPRLEMFARTAPAGWDVFGNEVESSVDIAGNEPATKCVEQSGTHINEGASVCASATEEQAEQIATKCVEESGTDIDGGTNTENPEQRMADEEVPPALPSKFTIDSMCDYIRAGKLPFDGVPMALTLKLYEMFGEHEEYSLRQIRTAIIAIEEPGMVAKSEPEPEQAHNWPVEVYTALGNALTKKPMKLTKPQRETVCSAINQKILNGGTKDEATSVAIELLQGYQSCAA